ncbi:protein MAINTENANCE OF MERISTEMS-like [Glycine soja]|uniref:protein MAINTENANCE OF MERISTEMS-like n=1 Tax=Glycine soja TaxID=3848 RepID=UPI00103CBF87|nr:protein MAINTENANCE OF MERISTEMS-like [Glycine soja]
MVRTRGLGHVLGHVTGRGVGRGDSDDSDDAPQHRRPTTSACRQRVAVTAEHDEPVVPVTKVVGASIEPAVYADEPMAGGDERPELKLSSHKRKIHSLGRPVLAIEGLVAGTGRIPLIACLVDTSNRGLLSSFVERWHRETSSFHLPMGEVTITLDDVSSLLHLPVRLPGLRQDSVVDRTYACNGYVISMSVDARKSATDVHVVYLEALCDLGQTGRYAWGVAALVHMYDHLNDASINSSRQLDGYITLLQCWIYKHFPSVAESTTDPNNDEDSPRACRWIATKKTMKSILHRRTGSA